MVDSALVLPPGFRVLDANGDPVNNAKIKFREPGPGGTKTVYSNQSLTTSLGHTVRTRSDGYPVVSAGSNTTTLIYVGVDPYYIEITDENDVAIFPAKDNVKGAVDTSNFLTPSDTAILSIPVLSKTSNYSAGAADKGKLIAANASGGFFTITLPSAVTVGDGWNLGIRNDGTSNLVGVAASQNIATSMGAVTAFSLRPGETAWFESNGATYKISGHTPPFISGNVGLILIADRLSDPPASPTAGARYLVGSTPLNAWSTFAEHDIAEANGQGGWFKITPTSDGGWLAYVQDEDRFYSFKGAAWVDILNTIRAADIPAGAVINRAYGEYTTNADITAEIPLDDSIPQNTEGTEIITASITLRNTSSRVRCRFTGFGQLRYTADDYDNWVVALFIDSTANALAATVGPVIMTDENANMVFPAMLEFEHAPGSPGPLTYKIRVGTTNSHTPLRLNGTVAGRFLGGAARATLVVEEIAA